MLVLLLLTGPGVVSAGSLEPATGRFLVATTQLDGPGFRQTVVLLVAADETGAMGLVVNRPAPEPENRAERDSGEQAKQGLFLGGPVLAGSLFVLFRGDSAGGGNGEDVGHVVDDVYVTTSADRLETLIENGLDPARVRVYAGYAGWGPGQLEGEIARGDWNVQAATAADVFTDRVESLWERLAGPMAPLTARLSGPSANGR